jgi:hypothetical protein
MSLSLPPAYEQYLKPFCNLFQVYEEIGAHPGTLRSMTFCKTFTEVAEHIELARGFGSFGGCIIFPSRADYLVAIFS